MSNKNVIPKVVDILHLLNFYMPGGSVFRFLQEDNPLHRILDGKMTFTIDAKSWKFSDQHLESVDAAMARSVGDVSYHAYLDSLFLGTYLLSKKPDEFSVCPIVFRKCIYK